MEGFIFSIVSKVSFSDEFEIDNAGETAWNRRRPHLKTKPHKSRWVESSPELYENALFVIISVCIRRHRQRTQAASDGVQDPASRVSCRGCEGELGEFLLAYVAV